MLNVKTKIFYKNKNKLDNRKENLSIGHIGNPYNIKDNIVIIKIKNKECIIDKEDFKKIINYTWYLDKDGYAIGCTRRDKNGKQKNFKMHRIILNCLTKEDIIIDHINRNKLDNRKENLRICTQIQNSRNKEVNYNKESSIYKGIYKNKNKQYNSWIVRIGYNGKQLTLGSYLSEIAAANCYNYYAKLFYKDFASLNDVETMEDWEKYQTYHSKLKLSKIDINKVIKDAELDN